MLIHPTINMLRELGLHGMATAFQELDANQKRAASSTENGLRYCSNERPPCVARSVSKPAPGLRSFAMMQIENADFRAARGLDRNLFMTLAGCDWIRKHHSLLVTGPAGVGKSWLACALGHKACREDFSVAYHRVPRLFATLALARGDGRYGRILKSLAKTDLLILDDWGPEKLNDDQRRDLLEIIEDRYERRSTIVTSQVPLDRWWEIIGNPTLADAILDRLVHNAYRIDLIGESMRKQRSPMALETQQSLT
ncbi:MULTISPECIES: IS21-like element helper ATPase IstB [Rhizobium]|uniref:Insertion sequence ATP-binding protein y4pL n=1 Tax=Rhizobium favelukesii TaxID=348824 RepID=W6RIC1_9HYPH|nr:MULTISPECIES: IS21-like element helper ATPase IstB [Rhizobium]MCS0463008.1 IS21-like element helper ATPase IstB [Rhizobium favelukesii]UFS85007.1 IS21-like element helper ATPase IstB [Rhizobium sp. T136]CDM60115.1 putative insertion sequence ATP-binding protein y4pL [Rhizobium favelukesii]